MEPLSNELLSEITRRLVHELGPEEIILFGSHAWGTPDSGSDVDLLIVVPGGEAPVAEQELRARRCLRGLGIAKDILVRSRSQIERYRNVRASLEAEILRRGRRLYVDAERGARPELADQSAA